MGGVTEVLFLLDTGCSKTTLDRSFEPLLGACVRKERVTGLDNRINRQRVFKAKKLYLGDTELKTGDTFLTGKVGGPLDCPYQGILGTDVLGHYCVQMDFSQGKVRFLRSEELQRETLGKAFLMDGQSSVPLVEVNLSGVGMCRFMVDSGFWNVGDLTLTPARMRRASENHIVTPTSLWVGFRVFSCEDTEIGGEKYSDLLFGEVPIKGAHFDGFMGRGFLARHLVTLDFPNRVLYLKRKV